VKAKILAAVTALLIAAPALADDPSVGRTAFTLPDGTSAQTVFKPDAPKIVLHAELLNAPKGTKVSADWIAEKTGAAPPNYKIDSAEMTTSEDNDEATLSLSKPNSGWPIGDYRVDVSINGEKAKSVNFQVHE
jgi:hypothetical protein